MGLGTIEYAKGDKIDGRVSKGEGKGNQKPTENEKGRKGGQGYGRTRSDRKGRFQSLCGQHFQQSMDQSAMAANPVCGQLKRKHVFSLTPFAPENVISRETGSAFPSRVSLLILHTQAESGAYSRDSSRFPQRLSSIPSTAIIEGQSRVIGSRNRVPVTFSAESPPAHGQ